MRRVGMLAPMTIATAIRIGNPASWITAEQARAEMDGVSPLRRMVTADEVAAACVFLASGDSASITGEDLNVAAGVVMY